MKAMRRVLFDRQGGLCYYCNKPMSWKENRVSDPHDATIDHVKPRAAGGKDTLENTVASCLKCNREKGAFHTPEYKPVSQVSAAQRLTDMLVEHGDDKLARRVRKFIDLHNFGLNRIHDIKDKKFRDVMQRLYHENMRHKTEGMELPNVIHTHLLNAMEGSYRKARRLIWAVGSK